MAGEIFVIAEHKDGKPKNVTLEIVSECVRQNQAPIVVALGKSVPDSLGAELAQFGAKKTVYVESEALAQYSTEGFANALHAYLSPLNPKAVLTGATAQGKDLLPRLAAKFKVSMAADCTEIKVADSVTARRPVYAGKCSKQVTFDSKTAFLTVRPNVLAAEKKAGTAATEKVAGNAGKIRTKLLDTQGGGKTKVELTEANVIISGGRSLKNAENFKILWECADTVGAAVGASRAAVDAGYAPHDMQVGQTGKTVSPKLYIACGISGAIQHLAGMRTSKVIVAINKDPEAPIFQKADYGIVGDLFEVVPHLTTELKALKARS